MTRNKQELTEVLVKLIDSPLVSVEQAMRTWYYNIRPTGGFRLTDDGFQALDLLDLERWTVAVDDPKTTLTKRVLLSLDRKLKYPYYIDYRKKCLTLFSSQEAMLATLYGDLAQFLHNYR